MQRVLGLLAILTLGAAACGGGATGVTSSSPTATLPPKTAAPAMQPTFTGALTAAGEVPPVTGTEASGSGIATVTFDFATDGYGKITAATAKFEIVLTGFPATTEIILAHIHQGAAGATGAAKVNSGLTPDVPTLLTTGGTTITRPGIVVTPSVAQDIIANPGGYYFNVHSKVNSGGVVRGQLKPKG